MNRLIFSEEHILFRSAFRRFIEREVVPYYDQWEKEGIVPREVWSKAGKLGFLGMDVPKTYGGGDVKDFRYNAIIAEELERLNVSGLGFSLHNDMVIPYILAYGMEEQKRRWLPKMVAGEWIGAIAMTEPDAGSDLGAMRTTAVRDRTHGHYVVNGSKTMIGNGLNGDLMLVACKTDPEKQHEGMSLIVIERGMAGFTRGRKLETIGLRALDLAELFFDDVQVPVQNLIGKEGCGFTYLVEQLAQERVSVAVTAIAGAKAALEWTIKYCQERKAFGQSIGSFQNSRFKLAEMQTEITIGEVFVDRCILDLNEGALTGEQAAMAKWWTTELHFRVVDQCVQLHGGYGYMQEFPISKAWVNARVQRIYAGTNEIMKDIIGRAIIPAEDAPALRRSELRAVPLAGYAGETFNFEADRSERGVA